MAEKLGVIAIYSGHDHSNDFEVPYGDVSLVYGRKTGFADGDSYLNKGGRVIELTEVVENGYIFVFSSSYIIEENG
jgi:hypothetical protein